MLAARAEQFARAKLQHKKPFNINHGNSVSMGTHVKPSFVLEKFHPYFYRDFSTFIFPMGFLGSKGWGKLLGEPWREPYSSGTGSWRKQGLTLRCEQRCLRFIHMLGPSRESSCSGASTENHSFSWDCTNHMTCSFSWGSISGAAIQSHELKGWKRSDHDGARRSRRELTLRQVPWSKKSRRSRAGVTSRLYLFDGLDAPGFGIPLRIVWVFSFQVTFSRE